MNDEDGGGGGGASEVGTGGSQKLNSRPNNYRVI